MSARRVTVDVLSRVFGPSIDAKALPTTVSRCLDGAAPLHITHRHHVADSLRTRRRHGVRSMHTDNSAAGPSPQESLSPGWAAQTPAPLSTTAGTVHTRDTPPVTETELHEPDPTPSEAEQGPGRAGVTEMTGPQHELSVTEAEACGSIQDMQRTLQDDPASQTSAPPHTEHPAMDAGPWQSAAGISDEPHDNPLSPSGQRRDVIRSIERSRSEFPEETVSATTPEIYLALFNLRLHRGQANKARRLVKYLVEERGERPNLYLYMALVWANCATTAGSAAELAAIFKEMRSAGIEPSRLIYHAALRVLAIHPDYLLRTTLLQKMNQSGVELRNVDKASVALGLLRDGQLEMALDYLDQMRREGLEIPGWVSDIFIYVMVLRGFMDEAVQLFHERLDMVRGDFIKVPRVLWSYLLDECSRNLHYDGTKFIWDEMVRGGKLNPPDGVAMNVLHTAARHGDTTLATAVVELLSARGVKLNHAHYEPLVETYVQAGDLENAFRVLCIIVDAGYRVNQGSTAPIYMLLKRSPPELRAQAVGILQSLSKERYLPVAAINVLLEAVINTAGAAKALECYREVCDLGESGPDERTFSLLLDAATCAEQAEFLVSEMDRFSIRPTRDLLGHVVRCFAHDGSIDVALLYLGEMDYAAEERTLEAVVRRCHRDRDPRVWPVVEATIRRRVKLDWYVRKLLDEIPRA